MITASEITLALVKLLRECKRKYVLPNIYLQGYEADVYSETDKYSVEYEVKISKADFLNDFKKGVHYGSKPKHDRIKDGERVNRFYFVTPLPPNIPSDLIHIGDIPAHAGLMYYINGEFITMKNAPILNKKKISHTKTITDVCYYKYMHYSSEHYINAAKILKEKRLNELI